MLPTVTFLGAPDQPQAREASTPASCVKLLFADRETKNAVAGIACLFIAATLIAQAVNPASAPNEGEHRPLLSSDASAATPRHVQPVVLNAPMPSILVTAKAEPSRTASPFFYKGDSSNREHALDCLAAAAWYEAGNDAEGQKSVMQVILNRVRHPTFPNSVCGVVFQGSERSTGCQFTFTCDGSMERRFPSARQWKSARRLGEEALDGAVDVSVGQATHYHADYVVPWWSSALQRVSQIGAHIFYRWPGGQGRLAGTRNWGAESDVLVSAGLDEVRPSPAGIGGSDASAPATSALATVAIVQPAVSQAHLIAVDPQSPNGRWAMTALDQCAGKASCSVMGYAKGAALDRNLNREPKQMDRPLFLFVRDSTTGMDLAFWDCDRTQRPQASQCLPKDSQALAHLMRNR
jgi:spore germination cell wall hydrolase CwlJ-like protein